MCPRSHLGVWPVQDSPLIHSAQACALSTMSNALNHKPIWEHFCIVNALSICVLYHSGSQQTNKQTF